MAKKKDMTHEQAYVKATKKWTYAMTKRNADGTEFAVGYYFGNDDFHSVGSGKTWEEAFEKADENENK